jgi:hypothetical protein
MIPKSGNRFSEKIMRKEDVRRARQFNLNGSGSKVIRAACKSPAAAMPQSVGPCCTLSAAMLRRTRGQQPQRAARQNGVNTLLAMHFSLGWVP